MVAKDCSSELFSSISVFMRTSREIQRPKSQNISARGFLAKRPQVKIILKPAVRIFHWFSSLYLVHLCMSRTYTHLDPNLVKVPSRLPADSPHPATSASSHGDAPMPSCRRNSDQISTESGNAFSCPTSFKGGIYLLGRVRTNQGSTVQSSSPNLNFRVI